MIKYVMTLVAGVALGLGGDRLLRTSSEPAPHQPMTDDVAALRGEVAEVLATCRRILDGERQTGVPTPAVRIQEQVEGKGTHDVLGRSSGLSSEVVKALEDVQALRDAIQLLLRDVASNGQFSDDCFRDATDVRIDELCRFAANYAALDKAGKVSALSGMTKKDVVRRFGKPKTVAANIWTWAFADVSTEPQRYVQLQVQWSDAGASVLAFFWQ